MLHLDEGLRATLLAETRERYKVEHDRFNQAFTRAGVYLGAAGVIATALYRFIDKPPTHQSTLLYGAYLTALLLTLSAICIGAILVVWAIIGRSMDYGVRPSAWLQHAMRTQEFVEQEADSASKAGVPPFVRVAIEEQMIQVLADATNRNIAENQKRFWTLFRASITLSSAIVGLIITGALYAGLTYRADDTRPTAVQIDRPVRVMLLVERDGGTD